VIDTLPRTELVKTITACRSCGSGTLDEVLDLGTHAVSDFYATVPVDELRAPLCLVQCGVCGLVQLTHSVSRDRLYKDYWYRSGLNPAMVAALKDVVEDAMGRVTLGSGDAVLDIGANDGTLLDQYSSGDLLRIGIEPSNIGAQMRGKHTWVNRFYPIRFFLDQPFKIITSIAMFYDLDDPNAFVKAIAEDLHPEGVWVNQMMDLDQMLAANAFDNICHEHVGYWSIPDFYRIVDRHSLHIEAMTANTVNGGSLRTIVKHGQESKHKIQPNYRERLTFFRHDLHHLREQCLAFLEDCRYNGKTVLGYGASTKGNTLLQYYGIDSDLLPAIAERNPDKVGKLTAGSHIPIISEVEMREREPDYLLVLPWSQPFLDGFLERERALIAQGTRLVAPLPTFRVIGG
jgi:NDP-4-keto-2,6-dideoxyhexose 3-C-methyltransferase